MIKTVVPTMVRNAGNTVYTVEQKYTGNLERYKNILYGIL